jgi:hypothetical protein
MSYRGQASSVPCEQILSNAKLELSATDRRTCFKDETFEILQIMKSMGDRLVNLVEVNDEELGQCDAEFTNLLIAEEEWDIWEREGVITI